MATQVSSRLKNLRVNIDKVHSKRNLDIPAPLIISDEDSEVEKKLKEITNYTIKEIKYSETRELKLLLEKFGYNSNGSELSKSRHQDNQSHKHANKENNNDKQKKRVRDLDSTELLPEAKKKSSELEDSFICRRALPFTKNKDSMDIDPKNNPINSIVKESNVPPESEIKSETKYTESNGYHSHESQSSGRNNNNNNNNNNFSSSNNSSTTPLSSNNAEDSNTTPSKKLQKKNSSFPITTSDYTEKIAIKKKNSTELPRSTTYSNLTPLEIAMKLENEGRELKHIADGKTPGVSLSKSEKASKYLQAGLKFLQSLRHREEDPKEKTNIASFYRTTAKFFTDCAKLFEEWQREISSLALYITLCYECQAVLLYRRSCKILPMLKKKRDDRLKDAKGLKANLASSTPVDTPIIQRYVNESITFYEELSDVFNFHDAWDKAIAKSKSLSNFTLPPILISIEELVAFIQRSLDIKL